MIINKDDVENDVWETLSSAWPLLLLVITSCGLAGILIWAVVGTHDMY